MPAPTTKVKSTRRADLMAKRWQDPEQAKKMRASLEAARAKRAGTKADTKTKGAEQPAAQAASTTTDRTAARSAPTPTLRYGPRGWRAKRARDRAAAKKK